MNKVCLNLFVFLSILVNVNMLNAVQKPSEASKKLNLREYISLVRERNEQIKFYDYQWAISQESLKGEKGIFEPALVGLYQHEEDNRRNTVQEAVSQGFRPEFHEKSNNYKAAIEGLVPTGGRLSVGYTMREFDNNIAKSYGINNEVNTFLGADLTQPLLKGRGVDATMAGIHVAEADQDIAFNNYREQMIRVAAAAATAYWDLFIAEEKHKARQESAENAKKLLDINIARAQSGKMAQTEVLEARAGYSVRQSLETEAKQQIITAGNTMRTLYSNSVSENDANIDTTDSIVINDKLPDFSQSVQKAIKLRPEYLAASRKLEREDIRVAFAANQRWPKLDLKGSYGLNGLAQTAGGSFDDIEARDYETWAVGFELKILLGGDIKGRSELSKTKKQKQQALLDMKAVEISIENSVDTAVKSVYNSIKQLNHYAEAIDFNEQLLTAEIAKFKAGKSNSRLVLEKEENLLRVKEAHLDSLLNYAQSVLNLDIAEVSESQFYVVDGIEAPNSTKGDFIYLGVKLRFEDTPNSSLVFILEADSELSKDRATFYLNLVAEIPAAYQLARTNRQAKSDVLQFAELLDFLVILNSETRFMAMAMTFCNEVAARYRCDRVSLGWLQGSYVRVLAISHMERFEKKMSVVQELELAMEEAFDQDEEILWPQPESQSYIARNHETFSRVQDCENLISLPFRLEGAPVGVVTCERRDKIFGENEIRGLRLLCDQSARRISDLKRSDRWFGARMALSFKEAAVKLVGIEHTFAKLTGLLIFIVFAFLLFGKMEYRVEAPFILKTDDLAFLPAPYDGYIQDVHVKVGDRVASQGPLVTLDTRELLLEESTAIANQNRYTREAEKAQAQNALADMRIARALAEQSAAQLKIVRHRIQQSQVRAPFEGIVVEGDLEELLGAPVRKGDVLFKVAQLAKLYAELKVDERDIHEIMTAATGEVAYISRPDVTYPIRIERIEPIAVTEETENFFLVRAQFSEDESQWWRPGMSGLAKINAGKRNVLWIFTHRTIDFLRIYLWW